MKGGRGKGGIYGGMGERRDGWMDGWVCVCGWMDGVSE